MSSILEKLKKEKISRSTDLSVIMPRIDPVSLVLRLGIVNPKTGEPITINDIKIKDDELTTYCPDHHLFVGRHPSDPKWALNIRTGLCKCLTEPRGSNIAATIGRLKGITYAEALEFIKGDDCIEVNDICISLDRNTKHESHEQGEMELETMKSVIEKGRVSKSGFEFFMYPPGKKPTLITEETVRRFRVAECSFGKYHDRVIIPFYMVGDLEGFAAIDILGKEKWKKMNPERDYRKVLYPPVKIGNILFNFDNIDQECDNLILTEGPREVMKLTQIGYKNSVALLGGNLTKGHLRYLRELNPKCITVFMDGDDAGRHFSIKIGEKLTKENFLTKIALTPEDHDPKSLDNKEVANTIENAIKYSEIS